MELKRFLCLTLAFSVLGATLSSCDSDNSSAGGSDNGSSSQVADNSTGNSSAAGDSISSDIVDGVIISEVMNQNKDTVEDENGESGDYILLYNGGEAVSLSGYKLSDDKAQPDMWAFPDVTIEENSFLLVFADSTDKTDGEYLHTNFSIGADGEKIFLTDADGKTTELYVPAMPADVAYGFVFEGEGAGEYHYFKQGAPEGSNGSAHSSDLASLTGAQAADIKLNEYMTSNKYTVTDNYGASSDWVELYNASSSPVDLSGYAITDSFGNPNKWVIPDGVTIDAGKYLIIWLDGLDEYKDGQLHASFKLSNDDKGVMLTDNNGYTVFKVTMMPSEKDISCGITENGEYGYFGTPTPGAENAKENN